MLRIVADLDTQTEGTIEVVRSGRIFATSQLHGLPTGVNLPLDDNSR